MSDEGDAVATFDPPTVSGLYWVRLPAGWTVARWWEPRPILAFNKHLAQAGEWYLLATDEPGVGGYEWRGPLTPPADAS